MIQEQRILEEGEITSKLTLISELEGIENHEETALRQGSRVTWLKEGDRNTGFFHKTTNAHRRVNTIDKLKVNEVLVTEPKEVNKVIIEYYENLYSETLEA